MSQPTSELNELRARLAAVGERIAALEEEKRIEEAIKEAEKKASPLNALEQIVDKTRKLMHHSPRERSIHPNMYQSDKFEFLEPIFTLLKNIQARVEALEQVIIKHPSTDKEEEEELDR